MSVEARVVEVVRRVIRDNTGEEVSVELADPLVSTGYLDSITVVSLVIELQSVFGIAFDLADMRAENFETVAAIATTVRRAGEG